MQIMTHKLLGEVLFNRVNSIYGGLLSKKDFIQGHIIPDLNNKYMRFRHSAEECWQYIQPLMDSLSHQGSIQESSLLLGVICHYISDSFCRVHNKPHLTQTSLIEHLLYEQRLHYRLKGILKANYRTSLSSPYACIQNHAASLTAHVLANIPADYTVQANTNIEAWLFERLPVLHRGYLKGPSRIDQDINYAFQACYELCLEWAAHEIYTKHSLNEAIA